jgi:hypothetical protein
MTRGAVYYVVRQSNYVKMAVQSAKSLKQHMPSLPITLFTDLPDCPYIGSNLFDSIMHLPPVSEKECHNQMAAMRDSPYDTFICMAADSWVCGDLSEIFEALEDDQIDVMAPMIQQYRYVHKLDWVFEEHGIPDLFPRYATGALSVAKNERTEAFLERWLTHYFYLLDKWPGPICPNQPSLRVALYQSPEVRMVPLPVCYDYLLYGFFNRPVKVIQAKGDEGQFREWEREANRHLNSPRFLADGREVWWMKQ